MNDVSTRHACSDGECRAGKRIATRMDFLNFVHHQQNKSFPTLRKIFLSFHSSRYKIYNTTNQHCAADVYTAQVSDKIRV